MLYSKTGLVEKYQSDFVGAQVDVQPGASNQSTTRLFAGAKRVTLLDSYAEKLGVVNFDLAVDFGMFYFLTKPIFYALHYIHDILGNFGTAILLLTVAIKLVLFPLANKSYVAMSKMKKLQPEIKKLQERFKDDKARLNQEMMALYKKENRPMDSEPPFRCVTASLHVDYLRPTPLDGKLKLEATVKNIEGKRVTILVELFGGGELCAKGEVVAVAVGEKWVKRWMDDGSSQGMGA